MTLVIKKCKSFQADLLFEVVIYGKPAIFFCTYTIYTFLNKSLQSPGTYISNCTWDLSQKAITK